jgi:hypothetical protein
LLLSIPLVSVFYCLVGVSLSLRRSPLLGDNGKEKKSRSIFR